MPAPTKEKKPPKTAAQHQQRFRNLLQAKGLERVTLTVDCETVRLLRYQSRERNQLPAEIIKAGILAAYRAQQWERHRARMSDGGLKLLNIALKDDTVKLMRELARAHRQPIARVLEIGLLAARRELQAMAAERNRAGGQ